MAIGNRKTKGKRSAEDRMKDTLSQIRTGKAAAMAYLKFLRENECYGTLEDIASDMYGGPLSQALGGQAAAFFSTLEEILRSVTLGFPLPLNNRRSDDHDQMCAEFVRAFNLTGSRRVAYLKELPRTLPQTLIKEEEAAAEKEAAQAQAEAPKAVQRRAAPSSPRSIGTPGKDLKVRKGQQIGIDAFRKR